MKQSKYFIFTLMLIVSLILAACAPTTTPTPADEEPAEEEPVAEEPAEEEPAEEEPAAEGERVDVRWFVGLGAGTDEATVDAQQAIVDEFNASQDRINLILEIVDNDVAYDTLATQIAAGNAPDIVGPVGIRGRDSFKGAWLDLQPLIEANDYDLSDFDPAMVEFYHVQEEGQLGIPFGIFPSFLFVNTDLFDEADLPYPPQEYGAPYIDENGEEHEWNTETLRELAMKLTVDVNGLTPNDPGFDPENIVQFGFGQQFADMRAAATMFGPGSLVADDGSAQVPDNWREGINWYYNGMWVDHFYPTDAYGASDLLGAGNWFQSGNIAMVQSHLWYAACCIGELESNWDTGVVPAHNGVTTAKMHADTFGIPKGAAHPEEAFEVLTYLLSPEIAVRLLTIYGGMPARLSLQEDFLVTFSESSFPGQDINWQVVIDGMQYADNPNHESYMPSFQETSNRYGETWTRLAQESGLDVNAELDALVEDLNAIFEAAGE